MSRRSKDEWLKDVADRQRNIVFPDTVQNEGRFWRNLYSSKQSVNGSQWVGFLVLLLSATVLVVVLWPRGEGPWWQKAVNAYGIPLLLAIALGTFIVVGNRRARRKKQRERPR
jgi:hypothetical protein